MLDNFYPKLDNVISSYLPLIGIQKQELADFKNAIRELEIDGDFDIYQLLTEKVKKLLKQKHEVCVVNNDILELNQNFDLINNVTIIRYVDSTLATNNIKILDKFGDDTYGLLDKDGNTLSLPLTIKNMVVFKFNTLDKTVRIEEFNSFTEEIGLVELTMELNNDNNSKLTYKENSAKELYIKFDNVDSDTFLIDFVINLYSTDVLYGSIEVIIDQHNLIKLSLKDNDSRFPNELVEVYYTEMVDGVFYIKLNTYNQSTTIINNYVSRTKSYDGSSVDKITQVSNPYKTFLRYIMNERDDSYTNTVTIAGHTFSGGNLLLHRLDKMIGVNAGDVTNSFDLDTSRYNVVTSTIHGKQYEVLNFRSPNGVVGFQMAVRIREILPYGDPYEYENTMDYMVRFSNEEDVWYPWSIDRMLEDVRGNLGVGEELTQYSDLIGKINTIKNLLDDLISKLSTLRRVGSMEPLDVKTIPIIDGEVIDPNSATGKTVLSNESISNVYRLKSNPPVVPEKGDDYIDPEFISSNHSFTPEVTSTNYYGIPSQDDHTHLINENNSRIVPFNTIGKTFTPYTDMGNVLYQRYGGIDSNNEYPYYVDLVMPSGQYSLPILQNNDGDSRKMMSTQFLGVTNTQEKPILGSIINDYGTREYKGDGSRSRVVYLVYKDGEEKLIPKLVPTHRINYTYRFGGITNIRGTFLSIDSKRSVDPRDDVMVYTRNFWEDDEPVTNGASFISKNKEYEFVGAIVNDDNGVARADLATFSTALTNINGTDRTIAEEYQARAGAILGYAVTDNTVGELNYMTTLKNRTGTGTIFKNISKATGLYKDSSLNTFLIDPQDDTFLLEQSKDRYRFIHLSLTWSGISDVGWEVYTDVHYLYSMDNMETWISVNLLETLGVPVSFNPPYGRLKPEFSIDKLHGYRVKEGSNNNYKTIYGSFVRRGNSRTKGSNFTLHRFSFNISTSNNPVTTIEDIVTNAPNGIVKKNPECLQLGISTTNEFAICYDRNNPDFLYTMGHVNPENSPIAVSSSNHINPTFKDPFFLDRGLMVIDVFISGTMILLITHDGRVWGYSPFTRFDTSIPVSLNSGYSDTWRPFPNIGKAYGFLKDYKGENAKSPIVETMDGTQYNLMGHSNGATFNGSYSSNSNVNKNPSILNGNSAGTIRLFYDNGMFQPINIKNSGYVPVTQAVSDIKL